MCSTLAGALAAADSTRLPRMPGGERSVMGRSTREELIGHRQEKMAGREKQSAAKGVRSLPASVFYLATHTQTVGVCGGGGTGL